MLHKFRDGSCRDGVACWCARRGWLRSATVTQSIDMDFTWYPKPVPEGMPVVQVYGWLLDGAGRVLVQDTGTRFNLPGGSPEHDDADLAATVAREAMEESQVTVTMWCISGTSRCIARGGCMRWCGRSAASASSIHVTPTLTVVGCFGG
jgi:8-oxo-dGTP pyrophosphatase MutT (NUDIX family)